LDTKSFEHLFKSNYKALCNFAFRYVEDKDDAEEIVQETFVYIWNNKSEADFHTDNIAYLYSAVKNRCLNHIKHLSIREVYKSHVTFHHSESATSNMDIFDLEDKIEKGLKNLSEKCREVFLSSRYEGLKNKEIAEKYDISVKTVENQIGKALKHFSEYLKDYI
jgi:RNA polymerase sigma-70 factor, ECF subfamily